MLQWHTKGNWSHRAYWGENLIDFGKDGTPERLRLGDLPAAGKWVRLEVPVAKLKLAPGTEIEGWAFTQHDGTVYWDKAGIETETPQDGQLYDSLSAWVRAQRARGDAGLARKHQEDRRARAIEAKPSPKPTSCAPTSSSTRTPRRRSPRAVASEDRAGRAASEAARGPAPDHAGLSRKGRRAQAGVSAQARRIRPERREGRAGRAGVSCRRFHRAHRSIAWAWPSG